MSDDTPTPKGTPPDRIFLQWDGDQDPDYYAERDGVTWAAHRVFQHDVEYVRADKLTAAQAENAELRAKCERLEAAIPRLAARLVLAQAASKKGAI